MTWWQGVLVVLGALFLLWGIVAVEWMMLWCVLADAVETIVNAVFHDDGVLHET